MPPFVKLLLVFGTTAALAQDQGRITGVSLTSSNQVRVVIEPTLANPDALLLQSSDSPAGPWWKEPESQRSPAPNGYEFLTPLKAYYPQRYYRFGFWSLPAPTIQFIAPNTEVQPGQSVTLLGTSFAPASSGNTVSFELPGRSWAATVTDAATNYLVVTVPTNLQAFASGTGTLCRVTVTTSQGTGNGVGCAVLNTTGNPLGIRPSTAFITQPPGTGKQTFVLGGGVPPFQLVPLSTNDLEVAVATLTGPMLEVVANPKANSGYVVLHVQDSRGVMASANLVVNRLPFAPSFSATFYNLLAGSAPGLTLNSSIHMSTLQVEKMELQFLNLGIEVSRLQPGETVGLLKLFYQNAIYAFQHLAITEVTAGRAKFDVVSLTGGGATAVAQGELIESPPTVVINVPNLKPVSLAPTSFSQELVFADDIFRLPAGAGQSFSVTANLFSVSTREDKYLPLKSSVTTNFTTTGLADGAPRLDRLLPMQGEVDLNVRLEGAGFGATPADNTVTFAGAVGTRVPADIVLQTSGEIVVTVPREAISGPVRVTVGGKTSNDCLFFVRFHPEAVLLFTNLTSNVPTAPRLLHEQPPDQGDTAGEVPLQSILCILAGGHIVVTNLSFGQQVGTGTWTSLANGGQSAYPILYRGRYTQAPVRYLFEVGGDFGQTSARFYYSEPADGSGVTLEVDGGDFPFEAGDMWDYQFTVPIYRPPAAPGSELPVRLEMISQPWMSLPGNEMRVIEHSTQPVQ